MTAKSTAREALRIFDNYRMYAWDINELSREDKEFQLRVLQGMIGFCIER